MKSALFLPGSGTHSFRRDVWIPVAALAVIACGLIFATAAPGRASASISANVNKSTSHAYVNEAHFVDISGGNSVQVATVTVPAGSYLIFFHANLASPVVSELAVCTLGTNGNIAETTSLPGPESNSFQDFANFSGPTTIAVSCNSASATAQNVNLTVLEVDSITNQ